MPLVTDVGSMFEIVATDSTADAATTRDHRLTTIDGTGLNNEEQNQQNTNHDVG